MSGFLKQILRTTGEDLKARKKARPLDDIKGAFTPRAAGAFHQALAEPGISIIAEVKRASPSKGDIRPELSVTDIVEAYQSNGARAISVLTEERYFRGSLRDLREARKASTFPILRKDFIIDPYQVWEAAEAGADAVLLIVAALEAKDLMSLIGEAREAGMDVLVEVHEPGELDVAMSAGAAIIGINNRNLRTFEVDLKTTFDMIEFIPNGVLTVSESGIKSRGDIQRLQQSGVDAVLIGETLMRSSDPGNMLKELLTP